MCRNKLNLTDEERLERIREQKRRYASSEKGKKTIKEANKKYQQTEAYKKYKREYYKTNK
jgi:hypothetical protein